MNHRRGWSLLLCFSCAGIVFFDKFKDQLYKYEQKTMETGISVNEQFYNVSNSTEVFIYSAFFEEKSEKLHVDLISFVLHRIYLRRTRLSHIRVIGLVNINSTLPQLFCLLRYSDKPSYTIATIHSLWDYWKRRYDPAFILCNITRGFPPPSLTISTGTDFKDISHDIHVKTISRNHGVSRNFTACVSPLHSGFSSVSQLVEWFEMHKLFGVEKFLVYVNDCSREVMNILELYRMAGIVDIVQWPLPLHMCTRENMIHYCGQIGALNDCLYRVKGRSRYIFATDLDEFIVPQRNGQRTWAEMLSTLTPSDTYIFRNAFFFVNKSASKMYGSQTQNIFDREIFVYPERKRSKYISVTDSVIAMSIHFPEISIGDTLNVDPTLAMLHHYRRLGLRGNPPLHARRVNNRVMEKYGTALKNAMSLLP